MSETTDTTVIDPVDEPTTRRPLVIALAAAGAVLAGVLVWQFLLAPLLGDGGDEPLDPVATAQSAEGTTKVAPAGDALDDAPIAVTYEVLLDRDPFDPVVPRPASETAGGDGTTDGTTDGTEVVVVGDPIPVVDETPLPGGDDGFVGDDGTGGEQPGGETTPVVTQPGGCQVTDTGAICEGRSVGLIRVSEVDGRRTAVIQVGSTIYEVEKGETFATNFQLRTVADDRVTVLHGTDEFTLHVGERVLK